MDAVGFSLEDYSILSVMERLSHQLDLGTEQAILPQLEDPKNLYGFLLPPP